MQGWSAAEAVNRELEGASAEQILQWTAREFGSDIALSCSFGGGSGMVLVDLVARLHIPAEVFFLDTGLLFPETYALVGEVKRRYGIDVTAIRPRLSLEEQASQHGPALWASDPDLCCYWRKVEPMERALAGKRAWISGIRRDQSSTRAAVPVAAWDDAYGVVKVNPLASWTEADVQAYIKTHHVPYNPLADQGYASIGCVPCTRPVQIGEHARSGRWAGFGKTECGLHVREAVRPAALAVSSSSGS